MNSPKHWVDNVNFFTLSINMSKLTKGKLDRILGTNH